MSPARLACLLVLIAAPNLAIPILGQSNLARRARRPPVASSPTSSSTTGLSFAIPAIRGSGGSAPVSVAVADLNGDGKPDLVVANIGCGPGCHNGGTVGVLLRKGGAFENAVSYYVGGSSAVSVAVADVNGDGKPDILVGVGCGDSQCTHDAVGVLLGNGDGTFQTIVIYDSGGYQESSLAVADMNGDGNPDIVVASRCTVGNADDCNNHLLSGTVAILLGKGDGTFQAPMSFDTGGVFALSVTAADVNGDGKPDVVVANCGADQNCGTEDGVIGVLLGNGDGTLQPVMTYDSAGRTGFAIILADVNGDGKLDLVVLNSCASTDNCANGTIGVFLGSGDGTFQAPVTYDSGGVAPSSLAVGDVNGDGAPDLLVGRQCNGTNCSTGIIGVLLGKGDGTFGSAINFSSGGSVPTSLAVADVNGDGKPDVLATNEQSYSVTVLLNTSLRPTTVALASSLNPSNFEQPVSFTATLTAPPGFYKGSPTGMVDFFDNATATDLGSSPLNSSGTAILQTSALGPSTHSIVATYQGDAHFTSGSSPAVRQVVLGAAVRLSPLSLGFGNQTVETASLPQTITLTNGGDIPLTFSSIAFTGMNPTSFSQTNTCGSSLPGGSTCTFSVTFRPTAAGILSTALTLSDNAFHGLQKVPITGVGVLPVVTISPANIAFPTQVVYTTSTTKTATLTNTGLGVLEIGGIIATGPFSQTHTCGSTLNPSASCTINVTFSPKAIGTLKGSVTITDNAASKTQELNLTGIGTAVQLMPIDVNFGNQPVGTTSLARTITLSNKGHGTVSITSISISGVNPADFSETNTCGASVASGASCFIKVKFKPSAAGARSAAVSVSDNGGGSPQKVGLAGTGT
jgi:hypothetical protein